MAIGIKSEGLAIQMPSEEFHQRKKEALENLKILAEPRSSAGRILYKKVGKDAYDKFCRIIAEGEKNSRLNKFIDGLAIFKEEEDPEALMNVAEDLAGTVNKPASEDESKSS